jgi:purine-binding chemotaxis protein CheW
MNNTNQITSVPEQNIQQNYIVFNLQEKQYAISIHNVIEIISLPQLEIPTKTPKGIIGIFNYNGQMVRAIDLCPLIGFEPITLNIKHQLVIANVQNELFAILIDNVSEIKAIREEEIQELPYETKNRIIEKIYKTETDSISIINPNSIIEKVFSKVESENEHNYLSLLPTDYKSKQILDLRAQRYQITNTPMNELLDIKASSQYILFNLDNHNYYIDLKYVKEFVSLKRLKITKLPYTKDFIKGIINLNGDFLIVLDLKRFLNNDITEITEDHKLIIAEGKNFNIALLVDDIKGIKIIDNMNEIKKNTQNNDDFVLSEFTENDIIYNILNFERIINDEKLYININ